GKDRPQWPGGKAKMGSRVQATPTRRHRSRRYCDERLVGRQIAAAANCEERHGNEAACDTGIKQLNENEKRRRELSPQLPIGHKNVTEELARNLNESIRPSSLLHAPMSDAVGDEPRHGRVHCK